MTLTPDSTVDRRSFLVATGAALEAALAAGPFAHRLGAAPGPGARPSPGSILRVATDREVRVRTGVGDPATLQVKRLNPETDGLQKGK